LDQKIKNTLTTTEVCTNGLIQPINHSDKFSSATNQKGTTKSSENLKNVIWTGRSDFTDLNRFSPVTDGAQTWYHSNFSAQRDSYPNNQPYSGENHNQFEPSWAQVTKRRRPLPILGTGDK